MADGNIIIDLKLENEKTLEELQKSNERINKDIKETEKNLQKAGKEIDNQANRVEKLSEKYKEANKNAEKYRKSLVGKYDFLKGTKYEDDIHKMILQDNKYQDMLAKRQDIGKELTAEKTLLKETKDNYENITNTLNLQKKRQEEINKLIEEQKEKQKYRKFLSDKFSDNTKKAKVSSVGFGKSLFSNFKTLLRISLALVGIRSTFYALTSSMNTWLNSSNEKARQLNADIKFLKYTIADMLSPAIEYVISLFYKLLGLVNAVLKSFTGVDYLAKALVKYTKDSKKNMQGTLASFDQLEVYSGDKKPSDFGEQTQKFEGFADKIKSFWTDFTSGMDFAPLLESFSKLKDALVNLGNASWNVLKDGYEHFLKPIATLVVNKLLPDTLNFLAETINWLADVLKIIEPYWVWFLDNVLTPLTSWVISEFVPKFFEFLGAVLQALKPIIEAILPVFQDIFEYVLIPLAEFTGGIILSFLEMLTDLFKKFGDWASQNTQVLSTFIELILGFLAGIWIYNTTKNVIKFIKDFGEVVKAFAKTLDLVELSGSLTAGTIMALVVAIAMLVENWDKMNGFERVIGVLGAVTLAVTALMIAVFGLQSAWSLGVAAIAITAGIVALTASIGSAKKRAEQEAEQSISKAKSVPKLAKGGIVNRPTQAIVGEAGREAVIPLENNTEWIDELAEKIGKNNNINLTFTGSLAQLGRVLNPVITQDNKRIGTRRITGGVNA